MLYSLRGRITHAENGFFVIECAGTGYLCRASANTLAQLPETGSEALVFTQMNVTQDGIDLYGFADRAEQSCFRLLTTVSGVGPKAALSLLSEFTADSLALIIASGDSKSLTRAKGIGPKAAQRITLELHDKVSSDAVIGGFSSGRASVPAKGNAAEAAVALSALGYTQSEAADAVGGLPPDTSVEDMIKSALKALAQRR